MTLARLKFGSRTSVVFSIKNADFELQTHQAILEPPGGDSEGAKSLLLQGPNLAVENRSFSRSKNEDFELRKHQAILELNLAHPGGQKCG